MPSKLIHQRLSLVNGHDHATAPDAFMRQTVGEVVKVSKRKPSEPRRQRVGSLVVRNAQGSLEYDSAFREPMDLGEAEGQLVANDGDHRASLSSICDVTLPVPVPHHPHHPEDCLVRCVAKLPDQVREQLRPLANDLLQIA